MTQSDGDGSKSQDLQFSDLYESLHQVARSWWRFQSPGHTLQPTALLHEAYLKMAKSERDLPDEDHFRAVAAKVMRQTLVDHARSKSAQKRGGDVDLVRVTLSGVESEQGLGGIDVLVLNEAIDRLAELNARHARVVEMRCFAEMTVPEIARVLDVSERTIRTDWRLSRAWLLSELEEGAGDEA